MSAKVLKLEFADDSQRKANAFTGPEPLIRNVRRMAKVASDCVHEDDRPSKGTTDPSEMAIWSVFRIEEMIDDLEKKFDEAWAVIARHNLSGEEGPPKGHLGRPSSRMQSTGWRAIAS